MEIFYSVLTVCISCCFVIWLLNRPKIVVKEIKGPPLPPPPTKEIEICVHKHELIESLDHTRNNRIIGKVYISRCAKCGDIKKDHLEFIK